MQSVATIVMLLKYEDRLRNTVQLRFLQALSKLFQHALTRDRSIFLLSEEYSKNTAGSCRVSTHSYEEFATARFRGKGHQ